MVLATTICAGLSVALPAEGAGAHNNTTTANGTTTTTNTTNSTVTWGECPQASEEGTRDPRQECATLAVPLDYRKPHGRTIDLAISRIPASDPQKRRGILLSNPGGPGGSGLDLPVYLPQLGVPPDVLEQYDLIGFDPRGVGYSTPVTCGISLDATSGDLILPYPDANGSIDVNIAFARQTSADCAEHSGDLLPYITTANTARDMDRIRAALGEPKMSYFGLSYGTYLGAVYSELFRDRTDRIVLDSAIDPTLVWHEQWSTMSDGIASRFPDVLAYGAAHDSILGFGTTTDAVAKQYFALVDELDRHPISIDGILLTGNLLRELTRGDLYDDAQIPVLIEDWRYIADAVDGTETPAASQALARSVARLKSTMAPAVAQGIPEDNNIAVLYAIVCGDAAWSKNLRMYQRKVTADRAARPVSGGMPVNLWVCPFWKSRPIEAPVNVTSRGARNVLVLQNRRDPATPWQTGLGLRKGLGQRAAFVGVDGGGHIAYGRGTCADAVTNAFLGSGVLPKHDVYCAGAPMPATTGFARQAVRPPLPTWPM